MSVLTRQHRAIAPRVALGWFRSSGARFVILSGLSFWLNIGLTVGLTEILGMREELSFFLALVAVFLTNFMGMRLWVYDGRGVRWHRQLVAFFTSSLGFRGVEYLAFLGLHTALRWNYALVIGLVLLVSCVTKYFFYKRAIFERGQVRSGRAGSFRPTARMGELAMSEPGCAPPAADPACRSDAPLAPRSGPAPQVALVLAAWVLATWMGWTGYAGSDDLIYANYAARFDGFPRNHWEFRVPYIAILRASFLAFGPTELAACLPSLLASAMIVASVAWLVDWPRTCDWRSLGAVLLACTLPLDSARSLPGAPYVAAGFLAIGTACLLKGRGALCYLGSALLAVGFLTHEVSFFYVAILCLAALVVDPRRYWGPVLACVAISGLLVAVECAVYGLLTGHPLIRYSNAADVTERVSDLEDRFAGSTVRFFTWPVEVLIFCKAWGLDLIVLLVAGIVAWRRLDASQRILFLATFGLWFWLGYGTQVPWAYKPRTRAFHYYYPLALGIAALLPYALEAALERRARLACALVAGLILIHATCLVAGGRWGQNVDVSEDLLAYSREHPGRLYLTDARSLGEMYVLNGFRRPDNVIAPREPSVMAGLDRPDAAGSGGDERPPGATASTGASRRFDGILINHERIEDGSEGQYLEAVGRHPGPRERVSPVRFRLLWAPLAEAVGVRDFMVRSLGGEVVELPAPSRGADTASAGPRRSPAGPARAED